MSSRWFNDPQPRSARAEELRRMLQDEWATHRRLYPVRHDSDVTPLGGEGESPLGQEAARPDRQGNE